MKSSNLPFVSVIIVNWNGGEVLRECLYSLLRLDYSNWELILVDNGSTDGSIEEIQKSKDTRSDSKNQNYNSKLKIIRNRTNLGFAKANNQGYRQAKGEYVLLLNNDTKVVPDLLTTLVERMESDKTLGVAQPKIYLMDKPGYLDNAGSFLTRIGFWHHWGFLQKDSPEFQQEREIFSAKGACMLIRRSIIEKVDLFDEDFVSYFEETDFCWRVWLSGLKVIYFPQTFIYHKVGFTIRRLNVANINFHYYKNRIAALIKNLELHNLLVTLSLHLIISFGIAFAFLIKLQPKNSLMILKAIFWNMTNIRYTLNKRIKVQGLRKVKDDYLFKRLVHPVNWRQYLADFKRVEEDIKKNPARLRRPAELK